ncbi:MAG: hypothetical protein AAF650_07480 [Pseudomonadota bacterium]
MGIEKLRQKAQREEAEKRAQQDAAARRRKTRWKPVSPALVSHPIFGPAITVWTAALGGLCVLALSSVTIARVTMFAGLGALGSGAQYLFACIAALFGAAFGLLLAKLIRYAVRRSRGKRSLAAMAGHRMRPIDPASELGSDSLDAPLEDELAETAEGEDACDKSKDEPSDIPPGLYEPAEQVDGDDTQGDNAEDEETRPDPSEDDAETPKEALGEITAEEEPLELEASCEVSEDDFLSLDTPLDPDASSDGDTLELSEGDAVEDEEPETDEPGAPEPTDPEPGDPEPGDPDTAAPETIVEAPLTSPAEESAPQPRSGLEKLRQTAPKDLSLIELVERFAAALHDVQDRAPSDFTAAKGLQGHAESERALADALKALALFSEGGFAEASDENESPDESEAKPRRFGSSFSGQAGKVGLGAPLTPPSNAASISETEQQLREALAKLQNLRGAA